MKNYLDKKMIFIYIGIFIVFVLLIIFILNTENRTEAPEKIQEDNQIQIIKSSPDGKFTLYKENNKQYIEIKDPYIDPKQAIDFFEDDLSDGEEVEVQFPGIMFPEMKVEEYEQNIIENLDYEGWGLDEEFSE